MKKPIIKAAFFCLFNFIIICNARAQAVSDTSAVNYTVAYFNKTIGTQSRLYNGAEYVMYDPVIQSNANYLDLTTWRPGAVTYDGYRFANVPLIYDINRDQLVALLFNKFSRYVFQSGKVSDFDLEGKHFLYIAADTTNTPGFTTGYYAELYHGKTQVLARYTKSIQNTSSGNDIITYFTKMGHSYLIKKDGKYISANSEGQMLDAMSNHKKEVQQYLKSSKVRFKKTPEDALVKAASFYDHLNN